MAVGRDVGPAMDLPPPADGTSGRRRRPSPLPAPSEPVPRRSLPSRTVPLGIPGASAGAMLLAATTATTNGDASRSANHLLLAARVLWSMTTNSFWHRRQGGVAQPSQTPQAKPMPPRPAYAVRLPPANPSTGAEEPRHRQAVPHRWWWWFQSEIGKYQGGGPLYIVSPHWQRCKL